MNTYKVSVAIETTSLTALLALNGCPKASKTVKQEGKNAVATLEGNVSAIMLKEFLKKTGFKFSIKPIAGAHNINAVTIIYA